MDDTELHHFELWQDYMRLMKFALRFIDPDDYGFSVSAEVRDAARLALGMMKSEATVTAYDHVERSELERNDK